MDEEAREKEAGIAHRYQAIPQILTTNLDFRYLGMCVALRLS